LPGMNSRSSANTSGSIGDLASAVYGLEVQVLGFFKPEDMILAVNHPPFA